VSALALPFVCAWCERVRSVAGRFEPCGDQPPPAPATHGICPECLLAEQREAQSAAASSP